ncbi:MULTISPECIES: hypothetical protein [Massilia]|jgi:hypothetical protein|uniref:Uncharacterized protein n=1 Tax=Massilia orientalis TaxID=3050128 RepID=A0ACC7M5W9_9BURK|nr:MULTISPECIES: hypothetical protein [unclassified Massilia]KQY00726.1 hypothetical protein ASD28_10000 [Massilia sp. Root133]KQZ53242.1 hypothetical protein ASD92_14620 [Massilia sp. Root1485]MDN4043943.1 hypothetical protein [Massilia sp. YIM B02787]
MILRTSLLLALLGATGVALADDAAILACRKLADGAARLGCYDAIPAAARPAAAAAQAFGLEQKTPEEPARSIESTIVGTVAGWGPATLFTLANGQVWKVVDGSSADLAPVSNPPVKIVRNMFGTLFLEIEGTNASPKVRRVR